MRKGFSLMELMIVVVIMGLLAMFVLPNVISKGEEAKKGLVCAQMKSIIQAVNMYKIDKSRYPQTQEGLQLLQKDGYFSENKLPKDSWKRDFIYLNNENTIELISLGADGIESKDDIYYSKCQKN
jgi:general secretion pathway protein G